jgi:hypothetical protein
MSKIIEGNPWIWVIVQGDIGKEQYLGQYDPKDNVSFIPGFLTKDEALKGFHLFAHEKEKKPEVQAVRFKELSKDARTNGFAIFILDDEGNLKEKIEP